MHGIMATKFTALYDFIEVAEKSRKYPKSTAKGLKVALRVFEEQLQEEEKNSLTLFMERFEPIYQTVFTHNGTRFSAGSMSVYKSRVLKVVRDYQRYGVDPTKIASWNPPVVVRKRKSPAETPSEVLEKDAGSSLDDAVGDVPSTPQGNDTHRVTLALREGKKFIVEVPRDISTHDVTVIKAILDSLVLANKKE